MQITHNFIFHLHHNSISTELDCIESIKLRISQNFLQLNKDKTEILVIGNDVQRGSIASHFDSLSLKTSNQAKNLGIIFDSNLSFKKHISIVTKTAYYHLRNISTVRDILSPSDSEKLVHAFVTSRLDYCNSVFAGLPKSSIKHLQRVQNAAARMLTRCKIRNHITPTLSSLHWLPVSFRIEFKILLIVFKCLHGTAPIYTFLIC